MKYIIDHDKKHVHEKRYALDRCSVENMPPEAIEHSDSHDYIRQLETEQSYVRCPYCHEVPLLID